MLYGRVVDEVKRSVYNVYGLRFYIVKIPQLRRRLGEAELRLSDVEGVLRRLGLIILARGSDGGASSWIIAVDPRDPEHMMFLARVCEMWRILEGILNNMDSYVRRILSNPELRDFAKAILEALAEDLEAGRGLKEAVESLAFTIYDGGYLIDLVNPKVKPTLRDVCGGLNAG